MALFSRIFSSRKNQRNSCLKRSNVENVTQWKSPKFDTSQIRLVLFQDHDIRGRLLLFDSKAIKKIDTGQPPPCSQRKNLRAQFIGSREPRCSAKPAQTPKYQQSRPNSDTKMLGEMMFGSVPMAYKGSGLKVHSIRSPPQLMVTKVFIPNRPSRESSQEGDSSLDSSCSLQLSSSEFTPAKLISNNNKNQRSLAHSVPVDVPASPLRQNGHLRDEDSGFLGSMASSESSLATPLPSPAGSQSSFSSNSYNSHNSLLRRFRRSHATSLETGVKKRCSVDSNPSLEQSPLPRTRKESKIGIAIIFTNLRDNNDVELEASRLFQNFFFSHIMLFESHVNKLQLTLEKAFFNKMHFHHMVTEALEKFCQEVNNLYTAPRLMEPVWLNMMSTTTYKQVLCQHFLKDFIMACEKYDNKNTNFFMSSVVTAVLTYHLAWVPTVIPAGATPSSTYTDKHKAKWLDTLAKSHPYNPLWAQLGDLHGAIGYPTKLARTLVVGKKADLVCKILHILSYFIRCSEVYEHQENLVEDSIDAVFSEPHFGEMTPITEDSLSRKSSCASINTPKVPVINRCSTPLMVHPEEVGNDQGSQDNKENGRTTSAICDKRTLTTGTPYDPCMKLANSTLESVIQHLDKQTQRMQDKCLKYVTSLEQSVEGVGQLEEQFSRLSSTSDSVTDVEVENYVKTIQARLRKDSQGSSTPNLKLCISQKDASGSTRSTASPKLLVKSKSETTIPQQKQALDSSQLCRLAEVEIQDSRMASVRHVGKAALDHLTLDTPQGLVNGIIEMKTGIRTSEDNTIELDVNKEEDFLNENLKVHSENGIIEMKTGIRTSDDINTEIDTKNEKDFENEDINVQSRNDFGCDLLQVSSLGKIEEEQTGVKETSSSAVRPSYLRMESKDSLSMFDEYFAEGIQTKTYDDLSEKERLGVSTPMSEDQILSFDADSMPYTYPRDTPTSPFSTEAASELSGVAIEVSPESPRKQEAEDQEAPWKPQETSRQISHEPSFSRQSSTGTVKCRSLTPTEMARRRNPSAASSHDTELCDPFLNLKEVNMPQSDIMTASGESQTFEKNLGRSLLAGYTEQYMADFVLQGTSDKGFEARLMGDLALAKQYCVLDEAVDEAVCIVADTDKWRVQVVSSQGLSPVPQGTDVTPSQLVCNMMESVQGLSKFKMPPEFCVMHLEDKLQEIYFKSHMLSEHLKEAKRTTIREVTTMLGFEASDVPLLLAVAGTHSPHLALGML